MFGLILYFVLLVFLFLLTWAGIGSILIKIKEQVAYLEELNKKIVDLNMDISALVNALNNVNKCLENDSNEFKKMIQIFNKLSFELETHIVEMNNQVYTLTQQTNQCTCEPIQQVLDDYNKTKDAPIPEKPVKKPRKRKTKTAEEIN